MDDIPPHMLRLVPADLPENQGTHTLLHTHPVRGDAPHGSIGIFGPPEESLPTQHGHRGLGPLQDSETEGSQTEGFSFSQHELQIECTSYEDRRLGTSTKLGGFTFPQSSGSLERGLHTNFQLGDSQGSKMT